ncbi:MAG: class I SAM-dependent methyltransferase [Gemmatimonadaceae bacterium]|nr:class I SAM-dependent methyltransferase [Gemmatimonadaceae bacterium]MCC6432615.1 class I SAM-dependent methyltransferase [Gemmatimonadaceae bacterium]
MSVPLEPLAGLHGDALDDALSRRWSSAAEQVTVGAETFTLFKPANADHLISEADYVLDERLPYWADLWPSSRILAAALLAEAGTGRSLLEMGCGLGLCTVAAMKAGFSVTATDYYDDALHVTRGNAARNLGREPEIRLVNWREWPEDLGRFDVVIAADVLYEKEYATLVAECLVKALKPDGVAIVADPGRLALPAFRDHLEAVGLELADTARVKYEDGVIKQEVQIMRLRLR